MEKTFRPALVEPIWRRRWEDLGIGHADVDSSREPYVIALPPPNITGALHMGHACGFSIQDTLSRQKRMAGFEVEWCPGTDHAAIATQNVIERQLGDEGTTKEELGRARFQARVDAWYDEYGGRIYEQMRRLGYTCDWSRSRFTLDDAYVRAIRTVFKALFDKGLIYRGPRIVNWCPRDRSAISDEEIDWQEHTDTLYFLRYPIDGGGDVTVATVRPETMLGDTGVAVSPGDTRFNDIVGRTVLLPLTARRVPVVADDAVKREFGTGAVKVTPGHDPTDYEIGRRHGLDVISVIAPDGTMDIPSLPQFHRMPAEQAREAVAGALRESGVLYKEEPYVHDVGHCDRCGHVLEPLISEQWWVSMQTLAAPGIEAVEKEEITFHPRRYRAVYLDWMRNIRDWCISRQIWLGHAIPVSECSNGHRFAWIEEPASCEVCGDTTLTNDPDVLDTWFSSALWPFAIFGWPDQTDDLRRFYPTDVLVTGRDIIFLWVARMIMTGLEFTQQRPFDQVMITSIIQAADGSRMSKSRGNVVDPLEMVERYGADAVRAWAAAVGTGSQDVRFDADRIEAYQRFANKLWNVTRLLVGRLGGNEEQIVSTASPAPEALRAEDRWMLAELSELIDTVDASFTTYRFHEAVNRLYDVAWHSFCDWYVEIAKQRLQDESDSVSRAAAAWTAITALDVILRLLHPFMPFLTEECAQHLPNAAATLQVQSWPVAEEWWHDDAAVRAHTEVMWALDIVQRIRKLRQDAGVAARPDSVAVSLIGATESMALEDAARLVGQLVPATVVDAHSDGVTTDLESSGGLRAAVVVHAGSTGDGRSSQAQTRRLGQLDEQITRLREQLANPGFVERAPAHVVHDARARLQQVESEAAALRRARGDAA
ncbi:MAG: valine--tRNA ligase [Candidatus Dormibacteraeota bacterium]|nr:valine--tRNA ligase [Candidatus Dormibacteraeota bacterium]